MIYAEYEQQIKYLPFNLSELKSILDTRPIARYAYIVHDKDVDDNGNPKEPHVHVMIECRTSQKLDTIASWFNDKPERIQKGTGGNSKYKYQNMIAYLIHDTDTSKDKYQYPVSDVVSNFDVNSMLEDAKAAINVRTRKHPLEDVLIKICNNEIPRISVGDYISDIDRIRYKREIETAYAIRDEKLLKEPDREMQAIYIHGNSGTGKTMLAKLIGKQAGYDVFVSGSSNDPLQGYIGQECIIFDDIRGSDWKINDLLKILDNHTNSLAKSRYSNKLLIDCKMMILTSVQSIEELYNNLSQSETEPIEQLKRRCGTLIELDTQFASYYQYEESTKEYKFTLKTINPIPSLEYMSRNKEQTQYIANLVKDAAAANGIDIENQIKKELELVDGYEQISMEEILKGDTPF